jgi:hypothetical protein
MSPVRSPSYPFVFSLFLIHATSLIVGRTGQPKTFLTRTDRKTRVCPSKVGTRIQRFPRQHRWLYEPTGLSPDLTSFLPRVPYPLYS